MVRNECPMMTAMVMEAVDENGPVEVVQDEEAAEREAAAPEWIGNPGVQVVVVGWRSVVGDHRRSLFGIVVVDYDRVGQLLAFRSDCAGVGLPGGLLTMASSLVMSSSSFRAASRDNGIL